MNKYLIVGGGITGILMGKFLSHRGFTFQGLEKSKQLGKDFSFGQLRFHQDNSIGLLKNIFQSIEWAKVDGQPLERKKGEWIITSSDFIDEEKAFLGNPFYRPTANSEVVLNEMKSGISASFLIEKNVEKIELETRKAYCQDGSEFEFENLLWCADLKTLFKTVKGNPKISIKTPKKQEDSQGGIHLEIELSNCCIPLSNSFVFPFRYKDYKLRAIGINDQPQGEGSQVFKMHWLVFVERELAEDREEVAKVIRALKRELLKEFEDLKSASLREKIVFQPKVNNHSSLETKGLELYPGIFYVGPEVHLPGSVTTGSPLDLVIENCKRVEDTLFQPAAL